MKKNCIFMKGYSQAEILPRNFCGKSSWGPISCPCCKSCWPSSWQPRASGYWIQTDEKYRGFVATGLGDVIAPLHEDANALHFAEGYFDGPICGSAYHYFGWAPGDGGYG